MPKSGEPYGYVHPEGALYSLYIDGRRYDTGFGKGFHPIDIKVTTGMHRIGYENNRIVRWTDLFVSASMKKDRILILEIRPGMRYYIGPEKRQKRDGYIFRPVVKKKEKILGYMHRGDSLK